MIGLAIGAGLLGFMFIRHARRHHAYACGGGWAGPGHWRHHRGGWGGGPWGMRRMYGRGAHLYAAMAALDLSPAQEKLVRTELGALRERGRALRPELAQSRGDLARAISGSVLDRGAIDATFARHDKSLGELRGAFTGALERIHAALDDQQRERLAEMLDRGGRASGPGGGPYRV